MDYVDFDLKITQLKALLLHRQKKKCSKVYHIVSLLSIQGHFDVMRDVCFSHIGAFEVILLINHSADIWHTNQNSNCKTAKHTRQKLRDLWIPKRLHNQSTADGNHSHILRSMCVFTPVSVAWLSLSISLEFNCFAWKRTWACIWVGVSVSFS